MGADSDDIDLALDKMYGKDFAECVSPCADVPSS